MATIIISNEDQEIRIENSELIPATETELKAIVKRAIKNVGKDIKKDVTKDIVPELNKELDRLFKEADIYVKSLVPEKGDKGDEGKPGKDAVITDDIKRQIALSVESQLGPALEGYADDRIQDFKEEHDLVHDDIDSSLIRLEKKVDDIQIPEQLTGEGIVDAINELDTTPENQIDAKHIKNLPKQTIVGGGSTARNFYQLQDTPSSYSGQSGKVVAVNSSENGLEFVADAVLTQEQVEDFVGAMMVAGTNIDDVTYDDGAGTITINASDQTAGLVDDTAYGAGWDGDTTTAPSKNAIYDKIESLGTGISTDTRENILAIVSPTAGETWYATDIKRFYLYTGTGWVSSGTPFYVDEVNTTNPDATPVESRVSGYLEDTIYGKVLSYCGAKGLILSKDRVDTDGAMGRSDEGRPTIYFDGEHKEFLIGVRIEKDGAEGGLPELQVTRGDNTEWVDLHNGDSDSLDANGLPIIHGWMEDFGAEAHHTIIDPN